MRRGIAQGVLQYPPISPQAKVYGTMIDDRLTQAITQIHGSATKLVLEFAGAGSLALYWLHSVPGSSRTILEATDRYAPTSLADLIKTTPEKFVSAETAMSMAIQAYHRATRLADGTAPSVGVGCTATIATDRVKRGDHGCWVAVRDRDAIRAYGLVLAKGQRDRQGEEAVVSRLILRAIAGVSGVSAPVPLDLIAGEQVTMLHEQLPDPIALLLNGAARSVTVHPDGRRSADAPVAGVLLSGSFNPLHAGHERLAQAAAQVLGLPALFELPIVNADKPPLSYAEIERRLEQLRWRYSVVLSRAPLFVEKAALFPGCVFAVGYDTAERLVEPRYYGGAAGRDAALAEIRGQGCRFLVAGRVDKGVFRTLADIAIPPGFEDLFVELPEAVFRADISSTAIRAQLTAQNTIRAKE